ncbi:MAG: pseudouridylate synthase [Pseudomonadales bacterium]|nr:pseudouridylate synthase [Pseudomonadales bacterium]
MNLEIIYQDEHYIAINKPPGLLVHRSPIDQHETRFAIQLLRDQINQMVFPVHRLDKPTSGVLLFALNKPALIQAQALFHEKNLIEKRYIAVVRGYSPEMLTIDHPVKAQIDKRHPDKRNHLPGLTFLKTLANTEIQANIETYPSSRYSLVQLKPITGRRHQLRYHMKHISHPIIGDAKYGRGRHNRYFEQELGCKRLLLAATELTFTHPIKKTQVNIAADPGADFRKLCHTINLGNLPRLSPRCNNAN